MQRCKIEDIYLNLKKTLLNDNTLNSSEIDFEFTDYNKNNSENKKNNALLNNYKKFLISNEYINKNIPYILDYIDDLSSIEIEYLYKFYKNKKNINSSKKTN